MTNGTIPIGNEVIIIGLGPIRRVEVEFTIVLLHLLFSLRRHLFKEG